MIKPVIVVVTYNRPNSLKRLLNSLQNAEYEFNDVTLIISIDHQDSDNHNEVVRLANEFDWVYGEKKIIEHKKKLGLKAHVLCCGDLVNKFNSIIMLEDDLFVSPSFYTYTAEALSFYGDDKNIGGISLYNHKRNFLNNLPFELIPDSNDVYFLQIACSWGQAWTKNQWIGFRQWLVKKDGAKVLSDKVPKYVRNWPNSSWLKLYINYLVVHDMYFVYPNKSLSTNFGDSGTHNTIKNVEYQVPLFYGDKMDFIALEESINVYDVYFEILPSILKILKPELKNFDFSVDLYGLKELDYIVSDYLLSSKNIQSEFNEKYISYGLELKPIINNIVNNIHGGVFNFHRKEKFNVKNDFNYSNETIFSFFFSKIPSKKMFKLVISYLKNRLKK